MRPIILVLALAALAGCDRKPDERAQTAPATPSAAAGSSAAQSSTPSAPASTEERKDGANPVQGQVDPKRREQHKDFKSSGDGAGPRGPDTEPKSGG